MLLPRPHESVETAGVLRPWPAVLVAWGPGGKSRLHAHHCWHLIVGLDQDLRVATGARGPDRPAGAFLTGPDVPHAVDARGTSALVVFVAPESEAGERLLAVHGRKAAILIGGGEADRVRALLSPSGPALENPEDAVAGALAFGGAKVSAPARRHPAIRRVIRRLAEAPPDADTSLETLARLAGLSPSRFLHAFTETVGVPLRPYLLWLKLQRAGAAIAAGSPLGAAAHAAGFADAAHMTRTFVKMFGVTPSDMRRRSQSVQDG